MMMFILSHETWPELSVEIGWSCTCHVWPVPGPLSAAVTPNAAADLLTDAQGCCTRTSSWLYPCYCGLVVFDDVVLTAEERDHT